MTEKKLSSEELLKGYNYNAGIFQRHQVVVSVEAVKKIIKRAKEEEREKVYKFSEKWFDEKRKNNDLWRIDQDDLVTLFLDGLKKEL